MKTLLIAASALALTTSAQMVCPAFCGVGMYCYMGRCIPSAWRQYANADDFCESEAVPVPPNFGGPAPIIGPPVGPVGPIGPVGGPALGGPILAGPGMCGPCGFGFTCRAGACVRSSALSKQTGLQATLAVFIGAGLFL